MANSETIKTTIDVNINTNGNQAITGAVMNSVLKQMVDSTDTELAKLSEEFAELDNKCSEYLSGLSGYYYNSQGVLKTTSTFMAINMIPLDEIDGVENGITIKKGKIYSDKPEVPSAVFFDSGKQFVGNYLISVEEGETIPSSSIPSGAVYVGFNIIAAEVVGLQIDGYGVYQYIDTQDALIKDECNNIVGELSEELSASLETVEGVNLFDFSNVGIKNGYYVNYFSLQHVAYSETFISHAIKVESGATYTFPNIVSLIGVHADYVFRVDDAGNIVESISCDVSDGTNHFTPHEDMEVVFVGITNRIEHIMFAKGDYPSAYQSYIQPYKRLSGNVKLVDGVIRRSYLDDNLINELNYVQVDSVNLPMSEKLRLMTPFSSENFKVIDDMTVDYNSDASVKGFSYIGGERFLRFQTSSGVTSAIRTFDSIEVFDNFIYSIYLPDASAITSVDIQIGSTTNMANRFSCAPVVSTLHDGLNYINLKGYEVGTMDKSAAIAIFIRIGATKSMTIGIGKIYTYKRKGIVSIWFDDQNITAYTKALPVMNEYGFAGAMSVISGSVGAGSNFMSKPQILEMKNKGWDLCNHTYYANSLLNLTSPEQVEFSIRQGKEYLDGLGVGNPSSYLVLPQGDANDDIIAIASKYATVIRYAGAINDSQLDVMLPCDNWTKIPSRAITNATTLEEVKSYIDLCVARGSWVILLFHNILDDGEPLKQIDWSISDFTATLDYLKEYISSGDIAVMTPSEVISLQ